MAPDPPEPSDVQSLAREAAQVLAKALAMAQTLRPAGDDFRKALQRAIQLGDSVLSLGAGGDPGPLTEARWTLLKAHAARVEDARHGANQLSQGSQRAPTREDCDDGWERVRGLVAICEQSAQKAIDLATALGDQRAWQVAQTVERAVGDARRIVLDRNDAYTFHVDPSFSFGEGWYCAAASLLDGVSIQVEPARPETAAAELFLEQAGLSPRLVPYRSRPRANKALPVIVAQAFRRDPEGAQARLRAAFLGSEPPSLEICDWAAYALRAAPSSNAVLLWVRSGVHHPARNTAYRELVELCRIARSSGLTPVLVGDSLGEHPLPQDAVDMTLFWKHPLFQGLTRRRAQLQLFEAMKQRHGLVGQIGVTTAGMDGPALMGLPTLYLTQEPNVRLGKWVGAVPGYQEVVQAAGYLERIEQALLEWHKNCL